MMTVSLSFGVSRIPAFMSDTVSFDLLPREPRLGISGGGHPADVPALPDAAAEPGLYGGDARQPATLFFAAVSRSTMSKLGSDCHREACTESRGLAGTSTAAGLPPTGRDRAPAEENFSGADGEGGIVVATITATHRLGVVADRGPPSPTSFGKGHVGLSTSLRREYAGDALPDLD